MWYYIIKVLISATLIVIISETSKRSSFWGGILASVPLIFVLAFIWLYIETKSVENISQLSYSIFWLVILSLSLFLILPQLLKMKIDFFIALVISIIVMIGFYYAMIFIFGKFDIKI
jgi:hypothetical protein